MAARQALVSSAEKGSESRGPGAAGGQGRPGGFRGARGARQGQERPERGQGGEGQGGPGGPRRAQKPRAQKLGALPLDPPLEVPGSLESAGSGSLGQGGAGGGGRGCQRKGGRVQLDPSNGVNHRTSSGPRHPRKRVGTA